MGLRSSVRDTGSFEGAAAVTPTDGTFVDFRSLWVGGAGAVAVTMADGSAVTFAAVPAGSLLPVQVKEVKATGTTATLILGLV
jgi:hypothetical protein